MNLPDSSPRHRTRVLYSRQQAFTLLEAILAVLIVTSVGIGIAALYVRSDKLAHGDKLHQRAVELTNTMAEQIRAHGDIRGNYETHIGQTCTSTTQARDKNSQTFVAHQVACWQEQVATQLANGSSRITLDARIMPPAYVIEVSWSEPRTGTASYVVRVPVSATMANAALPAPAP